LTKKALCKPDRSFATGRASGGIKLAYPLRPDGGSRFTPYAGFYGDYYFSKDDATVIGADTVPLLQGWPALATAGVAVAALQGMIHEVGAE
jgi:hypothetical protein